MSKRQAFNLELYDPAEHSLYLRSGEILINPRISVEGQVLHGPMESRVSLYYRSPDFATTGQYQVYGSSRNDLFMAEKFTLPSDKLFIAVILGDLVECLPFTDPIGFRDFIARNPAAIPLTVTADQLKLAANQVGRLSSTSLPTKFLE